MLPLSFILVYAIAGSFGGGPLVQILGSGFDTLDTTTVTVCGNICPILNMTSSGIVCDIPGNDGKFSKCPYLFHWFWTMLFNIVM